MMTTTAIKAAIIDALEAANIETTPATLAAVYHCFMETGIWLRNLHILSLPTGGYSTSSLLLPSWLDSGRATPRTRSTTPDQ